MSIILPTSDPVLADALKKGSRSDFTFRIDLYKACSHCYISRNSDTNNKNNTKRPYIYNSNTRQGQPVESFFPLLI